MSATTMTPGSKIPVTSGDISGSFLNAGQVIRLSVVLLKPGADTIELIRKNGTGYYEKVPGGVLKIRRSGTDLGDGTGSLDLMVLAADKYHVLSDSGFAVDPANATVTLENPAVQSGLASVPSHGGTHISSGPDAIPAAVAGGASGLMTGTQASQLAELSGAVPGAQTLSPAAPADGSSTALTINNTVTLGAGQDLLDLKNNGALVASVTYLGGYVGPTAGPTVARQHTLPNVASSTLMVVGAAQTVTGILTLNAAPIFGAGLTASGAVSNDFSGGTGTFKTSTGAVTIGGGANAIGITSSGAAVTITAGLASTWSSTGGAITLDGNGGLNLNKNTVTVADVGVTSATALTLAANMNLNGAAGTGALTLGSMTGATALPTGNLSWAGASTKTVSIVSQGAGATITITAAQASTWSTLAGALTLSGLTGINFQVNAANICDIGITGATSLSLAANASLNAVAGTGALTLGSMTGATTLPTGSIAWTGASTKSVSLVASGAGSSITLTAGAASTWSTSAGGLTITSAGAATWSTAAGGLTLTSAGAATWSTAAGALTLTSAAAATWSTATGTLTLNGNAGVAAQVNGTTLIDFGATTAAATTLAANKNLACAAGTTAVDLSLGTGVFKTTTGVHTFGGLLAATATAFQITDPGNAGAISVATSGVCNMSSAGAETRTLAAPSFVGQEITLASDTAVGTIVVTVATTFDSGAHTTLTFTTAGKTAKLVCITVAGVKKWRTVGLDGATAA